MPTPQHHLTIHCAHRARARGLSAELLDLILFYGSEFTATGARHFTLVRDDLPADVRAALRVRDAFEWIVVVSSDGRTLLTCYRRAGALRFLRFKHEARRGSRGRAAPGRRAA